MVECVGGGMERENIALFFSLSEVIKKSVSESGKSMVKPNTNKKGTHLICSALLALAI